MLPGGCSVSTQFYSQLSYHYHSNALHCCAVNLVYSAPRGVADMVLPDRPYLSMWNWGIKRKTKTKRTLKTKMKSKKSHTATEHKQETKGNGHSTLVNVNSSLQVQPLQYNGEPRNLFLVFDLQLFKKRDFPTHNTCLVCRWSPGITSMKLHSHRSQRQI